MIKDYFSDKVVVHQDEQSLESEIDNLFRQIRRQIMVDMQNEMLIERPPLYRPD